MKLINARKYFFIVSVIFLTGLIAFNLSGCKKSEPGAEKKTSNKKSVYQCPMHPQIVMDQPGHCPICHMSLVLVEDEVPSSSSGGQGMDSQAVVNLTAEREQAIGVRVVEAKISPMIIPIRVSGKIATDPELYAALNEAKQALTANSGSNDHLMPELKERVEAMAQASLKRLQQWGLSEEDVKVYLSHPHYMDSLLAGSQSGMAWAYLQLFQQDVALIQRGQSVELMVNAFPGQKFYGEVMSMEAALNAEVRSLTVRVKVNDPRSLLKPEMFAECVIRVSRGKRLIIPQDAVMKTGIRQLVFVKTGAGQYEPRDVVTGHETDQDIEIVSGLQSGENVVTQANFLIDSESKLKAALQKSRSGL